MYVIILVHACTHGVWAHQQQVSTTLLTRKNSQIFLVLLTGFEPSSFGSESDALPIEPLRHPSRDNSPPPQQIDGGSAGVPQGMRV